jgi:bacterioferritin-associated ferredoxin
MVSGTEGPNGDALPSTIIEIRGHMGVFDETGEDILLHILSYLESKILAKMRSVSSWFHTTCTKQIRDIRLSKKEFEKMGKDPESILKLVQLYPNLDEISLKNLESMKDEHLTPIFAHIGSQLKCVKLWLCPNISDASVQSMAKECPNLRVLFLNYCNKITNLSICEVALVCHKLTSLHLTECTQVGDSSLKCLAKYCTKLTELRLTKTGITDYGLTQLAKRCPRISFLDVAGCNISDISIQYIETHLRNLKYLEISGCQYITNKSISILRNSKKLHGLKLYYITDRGLNMASTNWVV